MGVQHILYCTKFTFSLVVELRPACSDTPPPCVAVWLGAGRWLPVARRMPAASSRSPRLRILQLGGAGCIPSCPADTFCSLQHLWSEHVFAYNVYVPVCLCVHYMHVGKYYSECEYSFMRRRYEIVITLELSRPRKEYHMVFW